MNDARLITLMTEVADGRTDRVFEIVDGNRPATSKDRDGVSLMQHCAYYGDVSAIRFLLKHGETLEALGDNCGLNAAAFHGHWRLCQFALENGADPNQPLPETGETPLHAALCTTDRVAHDRVLEVLLGSGANPKCVTKHGAENRSFMRDSRTKGETPLHRAAAVGTTDTIQLLLDAGAAKDAKDMNGDSPLSWASWYLRPAPILRQLCYGHFRIPPEYHGMKANLIGKPRVAKN